LLRHIINNPRCLLYGAVSSFCFFLIDGIVEIITCGYVAFSFIHFMVSCTPHENVMRVLGTLAFFFVGVLAYLSFNNIRLERDLRKSLESELNKSELMQSDLYESLTEKEQLIKEAKLFEKIVMTSTDAMTFVDRNYIFRAVNNTMVRVWRRESTDEFVGHHVKEFIGEELFNNSEKAVYDKCFQGEQVKNEQWYEYEGFPRRYLYFIYSPYFESDGTVSGAVVVASNLTELKEAEEKVSKSLKEKEVLLKEIHHRVKNNMAVISSLLSLQSTYIDDDKYIQIFKESQGRIKAMAMVHEKLYQQKQFSSINVKDYLSSLSESVFSTFSSDKKIKFKTDIDPVAVDMDTLMPCGLIVNELLTNSLKHAFAEQDEPVIEISLKQISDNRLQLRMSDNGIGIPFNIEQDQNMGLGLNLVKTLVSQLNGTLELASDMGSEFTITCAKSEESTLKG